MSRDDWIRTSDHSLEDMRYTDQQDQSVPFGVLIQMSKNLDFNTAFDLMKFYIQLYGLMVYVDELNKKVYAYTLSEVYKNIQHGLDWTKKVNRRDRTFFFTIGSYARTNYLALKEDVQSNQAKGMFNVINTSFWNGLPNLYKLAKEISPTNNKLQYLDAALLMKHILGLNKKYYKKGFHFLYLWYDCWLKKWI